MGVAVCDALGGPVEFMARGSYPLHTEMTYNNIFKLEAGSWTDDTSTALCLAESLLEWKGESHIGDQVDRYIAWWREGYFSVSGVVRLPESPQFFRSIFSAEEASLAKGLPSLSAKSPANP
jgi:ADP-ribosylglycohydrolase